MSTAPSRRVELDRRPFARSPGRLCPIIIIIIAAGVFENNTSQLVKKPLLPAQVFERENSQWSKTGTAHKKQSHFPFRVSCTYHRPPPPPPPTHTHTNKRAPQTNCKPTRNPNKINVKATGYFKTTSGLGKKKAPYYLCITILYLPPPR